MKQITVFIGITIILALMLFQPAAITRAFTSEPIKALLLTHTPTQEALLALTDDLRSLGCTPLASFPNQGLLVLIDPAIVETVHALPEVRLVSLTQVNPDLAGNDPGAQTALSVWNAQLAEKARAIFNPQPTAAQQLPEFPDNDIRIAPRPTRFGLQPQAAAYWQGSEYMLQRVNVDVFLVESNGTIDANSENWTTAMRDQVQAEITAGLTWWVTAATNGGRPSANLTFNINFHTPFNEPSVVATGYEPITRTTNDEGLWVNQIMVNLGYPGGFSHYTNLYNYNHARRTSLGTDWSTSIFVVNSLNDGDGKFSDGYFGYAYLNGPFMVQTYDNNGWGIDRMEMVTAHENSHIFGGLDEYASSGCTDSETGGYLNIANSNCENGDAATENSIMRSAANQQVAYPAYQVSTPVRGMVGWRDSDADGIYDPIDTTPTLTLNSFGSTYTNNTSITWTGSASDVPWDSPTHLDATISNITWVDYRINGGSWIHCAAIDGAFDETNEDYSCPVSGLADGSRTIEVRAINRSGNSSALPYPSNTVVIDTTPPTHPTGANPNCTAATNVWQNSCGDANFTWTAASDSGSGVAGYFYYWGADPNGTSVNWTTNPAYNPAAVPSGTYFLRIQSRDQATNTSAWSTLFILKYENSLPTGTISIDNGAAYATASGVTLTLSAADSGGSGISQMHFSSDNTNWSVWEPYTTSKNRSLAGADGFKTEYVQYRDAAGNVSNSFSDTILLDTTPPGSASISINGGAAYTSSTAAALTLNAVDSGSGMSQMRFSDDDNSWTDWETYASSKAYTLPAGEGVQSVYVQFRDHAGVAAASVSDAIILDTLQPTGTVSIDNNAAYASTTNVTLTLTGSDSGSGPALMRFANEGGGWSTWEEYGTSKPWTVNAGDGQKTVSVQIQDGAGNISSSFNDTILLDTTAPDGSITINAGQAFTNSLTVTLTLSATDSGSGVTEMRFSDDGGSWSDWEMYSTSKIYSLPAVDGTKTVYVQFMDAVGRSAQFQDSIFLDTTPPDITLGAPLSQPGSTISLSWSGTDGGAGLESYDVEFRLGPGGVWTAWLSGIPSGSAVFGPQVPGTGQPLAPGTVVYFRVQARDAAGNLSGFSESSGASILFSVYIPWIRQ